MKWVKVGKDGSVGPYEEVDPAGIDFSRPITRVVLEKVTRDMQQSEAAIPSVWLPNLRDLDANYRAIDAKVYPGHSSAGENTSHYYLYVLYATSSSKKPPYTLYFLKYNLTTKQLISNNVRVNASGHTLNHTQRATINRYPNGTLWAVYVTDGVYSIYSTTSSTGSSWGNYKLIEQTNHEYLHYEEDGLSNAKRVGKWKRVAYSGKSWGGYAYRSGKADKSGKNYFEFKATGTDFWLYTYTTTANTSGKKTKHCGKIRVKIDGKVQKTIDLSKSNSGWKTKVKLNKKTLSNKKHTIRIEHLTGNYFHFDAIQAKSNNALWVNFSDAYIRQRSGLNHKEALVCITRADPKNYKKGKKETLIKVDRSGSASHWDASKYITNFVFRSNYTAAWSLNGMFHEDIRGLWFMVQSFPYSNGPTTIEHYQYQGQTTEDANYSYSAGFWRRAMSRPPNNSAAIRYTAGTADDGSFSVTVTNFQGENYRDESTVPAATVSYGPDMEFRGIEFPLSDAVEYPALALNLPAGYKSGKSVGLLNVDLNGKLSLFEIEYVLQSAQLSDISDYVTDYSIQHDFSGDPSSLNMNIVNNAAYDTPKELDQFYELLPDGFSDRSPRLVRVYACFDQGPYTYEAPIFTGVLGEIAKTNRRGNKVISLSAYDYSMWLQKFTAPYYLVYASPPLDWSEVANDYPAFYLGGEFQKQTPRNISKIPTYGDNGEKLKEVIIGWDHSKSFDVGSFRVDPQVGTIVQSGNGFLVSPDSGAANHAGSVEFQLDEAGNTGTIDIGFAVGKTQSTRQSWGIQENNAFVRINFGSKTAGLFSKRSGKTSVEVNRKSFSPVPGVRYRVDYRCTESMISAWIYALGETDSPVKLYGSVSGMPRNRRLYIGSSNQAGQPPVYWDNLYYYGTGNKGIIKYDQDVACDLVAKAFQGMLPFTKPDAFNADMLVSTIVHPGLTFKDSVDNISQQNGKTWFFDYDGKFKWEAYDFKGIDHAVSDDDIEQLSSSFNPSGFTNWVEAVDGNAVPKIRLSVADPTSISRDGIRFAQVTNDELKTTDQARRVAYTKYYEQSENMETVSIELSRPLVYLKPWDIVKVESKEIVAKDDRVAGYNKLYSIKSVKIDGSDKGIRMSIECSSRAKAMLEGAVRVYNSQGVTSYSG